MLNPPICLRRDVEDLFSRSRRQVIRAFRDRPAVQDLREIKASSDLSDRLVRSDPSDRWERTAQKAFLALRDRPVRQDFQDFKDLQVRIDRNGYAKTADMQIDRQICR